MAKKIHDDDLKRLATEGKGVSQIARELNCTKGAISKRLKRLGVVTVHRGTLYRPKGDTRSLDMISQFMLINKEANELLNKLIQACEKVESLPDGKIRLQDPRSLLIKLFGEIKTQIDLWHELEKTRFNILVVREFMNELVTFLAEEVGEDARKRFTDRINQRESLRGIIECPELPISGIEGSGEYPGMGERN
ncbi:MAG: hypothetical protein ACLQGU_19700 [bacterium]